ncbi:PAS domain-containing protein [Mongoliibacter ruber]|uniref:histidine kinase n=1 Tax=Mongoliibacter ruber TaxID=1750599 RepID=A0A2T0WD65_9BACT|nr:PAS domain-containing protein [Mongoliibacter ruber]PRY84647.1 PAS domain S-box-containing protein [Mongoliibacter ruber]
MIIQLAGIQSFFEGSKTPSTIICFEKGVFSIEYSNEAFQVFFEIEPEHVLGSNLPQLYLRKDFPESFIDGKLEEVSRKIAVEKGSEEFHVDYFDYDLKNIENLKLGFTFLVEHEGKQYLSHTICHQTPEILRSVEKDSFQDYSENMEILVNSIEGIVWEADPTTLDFTYVSPQCQDILGFTSEEWLDVNEFWQNHIHPDDRQFAINLLRQETNACRDHILEFRMLSKDGNYIWLRNKVTVISEYGKPQLIKGVMFDITKEKELSEDIRLLINNTDEAFILINLDYSVKIFNDQFSYLFKKYYKQEIKIDASILAFVPDENKEEIRILYRKVFEGKSKKTEFSYKDENNNPIVFSVEFRPAKNLQNEIIGAFVTAKDISVEKKMLDSLKKRELALKNIFDRSLDVICTLDEHGVFRSVSAASKNVWGYAPEELVGRSFLDLVIPEDHEISISTAEKIIGGEEVTNFQNHYRHKNGEIVTVNWSGKWYEEERIIYSVAKDVSTLEKSFKDIQKSEARFRGMYESSSFFVIRTDFDGNYTYCNKKYIDQFSWLYPDGNFLGKSIWATVLKKDFAKVEETGMKAVMNPGVVFNVEIDKPTIDEGVISTLWDFMAIFDENGVPIELQCVGTDITDRVKFENELQQSNERFELVMQASSESIWDYNPVTKEMFLGDGFGRDFGLEIKDLDQNYDYINEQFHPEDREGVLQFFNHTLSDPEKNRWESKYRFKNGSGSYIFIENRAVILRDKNGKAVRVVGAIQDVNQEVFYHQLEMMEKEVMAFAMQIDVDLKEVIDLQLNKLEDIFPGMRSSVMRVREDKIWKLTSPSLPDDYFEEINGIAIGEKAGTCGTAAFLRKRVFVTNVNSDPLWENFSHLGQKYGFKACWSQPIFNSEGEVVATFANYYEEEKSPSDFELQAMDRVQRLLSLILEKFEFIEQIKLTNERFENVTEATNDAIWDYDAVQNELYWSQGFESLFKYDLSTLIPTFDFLMSRIHEEDRSRVINKVNTYLSDQSSVSWFEEYRFERGDGSFAYVIDRAKFIRNEEGKVLRVIGAMTDITHLKEYESSLESLNKVLDKRAKELAISNAELEQFAYVASHDLQEPLRMVTSFLHQLEKKYGDIIDEKGKKYIHFAVDGASRMRNIILDLLEYSRVGKDAEDKTHISLNHIVDEVLILQKRSMEEKKAIIKVDPLPEIWYHHTPIFQVFKNLIENALKYYEPNRRPEIHISCEENENEYVVSVTDNGIGIEKEHFDRIFIIFQRLHAKDNYTGTGMGLAIVKKVVEGLDGNVWIESEPGKGSVFCFTIPKRYLEKI